MERGSPAIYGRSSTKTAEPGRAAGALFEAQGNGSRFSRRVIKALGSSGWNIWQREKGQVAIYTVDCYPAGSELGDGKSTPDCVVNGQEFWNVGCLRGRRQRWEARRGHWVVEYLVRWEKHGAESDTWAPRESPQQDVRAMVREFEEALSSWARGLRREHLL